MWDHLTFQHKPNLFYSQLACIQGLNTGISGKSFGMKWPLDLSNNVHFGKIIPVQLFFQVCAHRRHTLLTAYFVSNANESWIPKVDARRSNKSRAKTPAAYRQNLHFLKKPKPKSFHLYGFIFLWLLKKLSQFIFWCQKVTSGLEMARCALPSRMVWNNLPDFWEDRATTRAGSISQGRPAAEDSSYTFMATWKKGEFQVRQAMVTADGKFERHPTFMSVSRGMWSLKSSTELTRKGMWQDSTWRKGHICD